MNIKQLFVDEDAVSPVIGVILMVAITVILAAVIGTFVLGLGRNVQESPPQANFQFEYPNSSYTVAGTNQVVKITHTGGEDVERSNIDIQIGSAKYTAFVDNNATDNINPGLSSTLSTGSQVGLWDNGTSHESVEGTTDPEFAGGDDVRVIWESPSGDQSSTIGTSTVPS